MIPISEDSEWLETDGLGGFAMGTTALVRTRRYHGLLLSCSTPPSERVMLVSGLEAWLESPLGRFALSTQRYVPDVLHPEGARSLTSFSIEPWPRWKFEPAPGLMIEHEIFVRHGWPTVVLRWSTPSPTGSLRLCVRPLLAGRELHGLQRENGSIDLDPTVAGGRVTFRPYPHQPAIHCWFDGEYAHDPSWYRRFCYAEERARGLDHVEDLASPGVFSWSLEAGSAELVLSAAEPGRSSSAAELAREIAQSERTRRASFVDPLERAADQYLVTQPGVGRGIVAGYPWFGQWGRDTFIALRGLCIATGRIAEARDVLLAWSENVSEGMLPNRLFEDGAPEYNSVDAALWFVIAAGELCEHPDSAKIVSPADVAVLTEAVKSILIGYLSGTRHRIQVDADGLLAAGDSGVQLTWMDAKLGDFVVTPRSGKPVEIQALWVNALAVAERFDRSGTWTNARRHALDAFGRRFWCEERGYLYDVVDVDHVAGRLDASLRPNQVLALGGLPIALLDGRRARRAMDAVVEQLWTPLGPRSLAPTEPSYVAHYRGGVRERDLAYHQGTVWPWLAGPLVQAWLATRDDDARLEARQRFLAPLEAHLASAGIGHVSEIADAEPPHTPRGCPFQAWSVGELLRLRRLLA